MRKTIYEGPAEGEYIDGNFYSVMESIGEASLVANETFPRQDSGTKIGYVRNVWNLDDVTVFYAYNLDPRLPEMKIRAVKVILGGEYDKFGEVEKKISEALERTNARAMAIRSHHNLES